MGPLEVKATYSQSTVSFLLFFYVGSLIAKPQPTISLPNASRNVEPTIGAVFPMAVAEPASVGLASNVRILFVLKPAPSLVKVAGLNAARYAVKNVGFVTPINAVTTVVVYAPRFAVRAVAGNPMAAEECVNAKIVGTTL